MPKCTDEWDENGAEYVVVDLYEAIKRIEWLEAYESEFESKFNYEGNNDNDSTK